MEPETNGTLTAPETTPLSKGHKLSHEERLRVVELIAQYKGPTEIQRLIREEFGKLMRLPLIEQYRRTPKWAPFIARYRAEYLAQLTDVAIAQSKVRLERLEEQWLAVTTDPKLTKVPHLKRHEQRAILKAAREETQAVQGHTNVNVSVTNIAMMPTAELEARRTKILEELKTLEVDHAG